MINSIFNNLGRHLFDRLTFSGAPETEELARKKFFEYMENNNFRSRDYDLVPRDHSRNSQPNQTYDFSRHSNIDLEDILVRAREQAAAATKRFVEENEARIAAKQADDAMISQQAQKIADLARRIEEQERANVELREQLASLFEASEERDEAQAELVLCNNADRCREDAAISAVEEDTHRDCSEPSMTSQVFCERVEDVARRRHWRTAFAHRLRTTVGALKADLQGDTVPQRLVAMLDTLTTDDLLPASRQHWTAEERVHLSVLLDDGLSDVELAHRLSAEFGRRIFAGGVARQRRRLQRIAGKPGSCKLPSPNVPLVAKMRGTKQIERHRAYAS